MKNIRCMRIQPESWENTDTFSMRSPTMHEKAMNADIIKDIG